MDIDKLKNTQLPLIIRDSEGLALGQITATIAHSLTSASFTMTFQNESKVLSNKDIIKEAFDSMQDFFKREMSSCGWDFLYEEETTEVPTEVTEPVDGTTTPTE